MYLGGEVVKTAKLLRSQGFFSPGVRKPRNCSLKRNSTVVEVISRAVDLFVLAIKGEKKCHKAQIAFFARLLSPIRSSKRKKIIQKSFVDFESVKSPSYFTAFPSIKTRTDSVQKVCGGIRQCFD